MSIVCKSSDWEIFVDGVQVGTLKGMEIPEKTAEEKEADRKKGLARLQNAIQYAMRNPS